MMFRSWIYHFQAPENWDPARREIYPVGIYDRYYEEYKLLTDTGSVDDALNRLTNAVSWLHRDPNDPMVIHVDKITARRWLEAEAADFVNLAKVLQKDAFFRYRNNAIGDASDILNGNLFGFHFQYAPARWDMNETGFARFALTDKCPEALRISDVYEYYF